MPIEIKRKRRNFDVKSKATYFLIKSKTFWLIKVMQFIHALKNLGIAISVPVRVDLVPLVFQFKPIVAHVSSFSEFSPTLIF